MAEHLTLCVQGHGLHIQHLTHQFQHQWTYVTHHLAPRLGTGRLCVQRATLMLLATKLSLQPYLLCFKQGHTYPRVARNLLWSWKWPWTSDSSYSQAPLCPVHPRLGQRSPGFINTRQASHQLNYIPSSKALRKQAVSATNKMYIRIPRQRSFDVRFVSFHLQVWALYNTASMLSVYCWVKHYG